MSTIQVLDKTFEPYLKELENIIYGGHIPIFCQDYDFKNDVYVRNMNPQI